MKINIDVNGSRMKCYVLNHRKAASKRPGILYIHGGGYILGSALLVYFSSAKTLAKETDAVILSPEYRLAGKAPYPAALEDCYAALEYMYDHAGELGIDKTRISVVGYSAGGGLTAAVCMYARDKGKISVHSQIPLYPMLDCDDTESSRDNHAYVWNTKRNHYGWGKYLKGTDRSKEIPPYASPAKQTDYSKLPPAYTFVCDGEPFYRETLTFVDNLKKAGVDAKVDVYHANIHAIDMFIFLPVARRATKAFLENAQRLIK